MPLTPEDASAVAAAFGLGGDAVLSDGPLARGEHGFVWRLDCDAGVFAVKDLMREPDEPHLLAAEVAFQEAAVEAGVPAPRPVRSGGAEVAVSVGSSRVRVHEWVDLLEVDPSADPAQVGAVVARLHLTDDPGGLALHPWYREPVGADRWDELVGQLRARGSAMGDELAALRDEIVAMEALLTEPSEVRTCHRDLWADNVRRTVDGGLAVIDWDNCGLADPSQELAMVVYEFGMGDPERAKVLHEACRAEGGPGRLTRPQDFSMVVAVLGHINERVLRLWLEPGTAPDEQDRLAAVFHQFVDRPLTRALIEQTLDAVHS